MHSPRNIKIDQRHSLGWGVGYRWCSGKEATCQCRNLRDRGSIVEEGMAPHSSIPRQRSLAGALCWGHKELDMTEHLSMPSPGSGRGRSDFSHRPSVNRIENPRIHTELINRTNYTKKGTILNEKRAQA